MRRNTIVLGVTLLLLAVFAWVGWANWQYRKQAAEKAAAKVAQGKLEAGESADAMFTSSPLLGKPAPDFELIDMKGNKVTLADYKGKALLINFWATWCGPCKLETPWLVELQNEYGPKGFTILGVNSEDDNVGPDDKDGWAKDKAAVEKFVAKEKMNYPVLMNGDSITKAYGDPDVEPASFFVDRSGKVIAAQMGITSKDDMAAKIEKALE